MKLIHSRSHLLTLALLLVSFVLGACGTLDIRFEMPTPAPGSGDIAAPDRDSDSSPAGDLPTITRTPYPQEITPTATAVDYDPWPAEPAFTPVPAGEYPAPSGLRLVFGQDGQIWLWTAGTGEPVALAALDNAMASELKISDDGALVAFSREDGLWVVGSDGKGERQLISKERLDALSVEGTSLALNRLEWVPGTHVLAFNTRLDMAYGLVLSDDLHLVDAGSGEWTVLLPPGQGGEFYLAPDGRQIAVVTAGDISLVDADGSNRRDGVLTYTPVNTGSEFRFYARPFWAPDGSALRVAIPPADPFAQPAQYTSIWHVPTDGTAARLLTSVDAAPLLSSDSIAFSSDLEYVAYAQARLAEGASPAEAEPWLVIQRLANGDQQSHPHAGDVVRWAPDSYQFAFVAGRYEPRLYIGQWSGPILPGAVDSGRFVNDVRWLDAERYLFAARRSGSQGAESERWEIVLAHVGGTNTILASMGGFPRYDFALVDVSPPAASLPDGPTPTPWSDSTSFSEACRLSPLEVPLAVPWAPTLEMVCPVRHDPETGNLARILDYGTDDGACAPGDRITVHWEAEGGEMVLLELYDTASIGQAREGEATSVPTVGFYDHLPLAGQETLTLPQDLAGGVRIVLWVANGGPPASPVVMYEHLAFVVLDLPCQAG